MKAIQLPTIALTILFLALASPTYADPVYQCSERLQTQESEMRERIRNSSYKKAALYVAAPMAIGIAILIPPVGATVAASIILGSSFGLAGGSVAWTGGAAIIRGAELGQLTNAMNLFSEARSCDGTTLRKVWKKFKRQEPELASRFTRRDFCDAIIISDIEGTGCNDEYNENVIFSREEFVKMVAVDLSGDGEE
jgi:hypothetical protein